MLPALVLCLLASPADPPPLSVTTARVEVLEGRAALAGPEGVRELVPGQRPWDVEGAAYLEIPARARVSVRWRATASLLLHGPATLEWGPGTGRSRLEWRLLSLSETHLEVRRGPVHTSLPGGWEATIETGAAYCRSRPGGGLELHHDAGLPIHLVAPHPPNRALPPLVVLPGAQLRLDPDRGRPQPFPGSSTRVLTPYAQPRRPQRRSVGPWNSFSWPWQARGAGAAPVPGVLVTPPDEAGESHEGSDGPLEPGDPEETPPLATTPAMAPARAEEPELPGIPLMVFAPWLGGPESDLLSGPLELTPWGVRWKNR